MTSYQNIFIIGANGSIGIELVKSLKIQYPGAVFFGTYNSNKNKEEIDEILDHSIHLDVLADESWCELGKKLSNFNINFDLIISTIGTLKGNAIAPEKSLRDINLKQLKSVFNINAFHSVLVAKEFKNYISKSKSTRLVYLSAMVGSITENEIGGWYSYRASKTALNMFVKNMSIEFGRSRPHLKVLAIHPGTTNTTFSQKYLKGVKHKVWTASETAGHILSVIENDSYATGSFLNWDGRTIEW